MDLLFTGKHFLALVIAVIVIAAILFIMNKLKLKSSKIIIFTAVVFYVFEFLKQGYWVYSGVFAVEKLPLYPCNMPLYIMPFSIFGTQKMKDFLKPFLYVIFLGGGLLTLIYPSIILGTSATWNAGMENFVPFISVVAHATMVGVAIYLLTSGYYKIRKNDYIRIFVVIFTMYLVTYGFNKIFDTDFFFSNYGEGLPSFIQNIKSINELVFAIVVFLVGLGILYITYWSTLLFNKLNENKYMLELNVS